MRRPSAAGCTTVAAVGWLAYCLAQYAFSGRRWAWWWVPADVLPPFVFVLVPAAVLAALAAHAVRAARREGGPRRVLTARGWWLPLCGGAAVLSLLLGAGRSGVHPFAPGGGGPVPPGALRVVSFNTSYWGADTDPATFYRYLRELDADVYLLQEYLRWDEEAASASGSAADGAVRLDERERLRREFPGYRVVTRGELVTLSRVPVVRRPPVAPDRAERVGWREEFTRAKALRTDLLVGGRVLSVYNVHLPVQLAASGMLPLSPAFFSDVRERAGPRRAAFAGLEADALANPCPLLIAGDFNTTAAMGELDPLRDRLRDAARSGGPAYPASWPDGSALTGWRLDWAFTAGGVRVHRYALAGSHGISDHRRQDIWLSPHGAARGCPRP